MKCAENYRINYNQEYIELSKSLLHYNKGYDVFEWLLEGIYPYFYISNVCEPVIENC